MTTKKLMNVVSLQAYKLDQQFKKYLQPRINIGKWQSSYSIAVDLFHTKVKMRYMQKYIRALEFNFDNQQLIIQQNNAIIKNQKLTIKKLQQQLKNHD